MIVSVNERGSVTLPANLRKSLSIQTGDPLEILVENGNIILIPVEVIPKRIALTQSGQQKEAAAQRDIRANQWKAFDTAEALIEDLTD